MTYKSLAFLLCLFATSLQAKDCKTCCPPTRICHVPYKIEKSGKYCVNKDLVYTGHGRAIEVNADNVTIHFNNHNLTLTQPDATGIFAVGVSELLVDNDKIAFTAPLANVTGSLIHLEEVNKATFDNLFLENAARAIFADRCSDIHLINSQVRECTAANIDVEATSGFVVDNCNFYNTALSELDLAGLYFNADSENCRITNSQMYNSDIFGRQVKNFLVDNVSSVLDDPAYIFSLCQVGSATADLSTNAIVRNSLFTNDSAEDAFCLDIVHVDGMLVENTTAANTLGFWPALYIEADEDDVIRNVKIDNCLLTGASRFNVGIINRDGEVVGIEICNSVLQGAYEADLHFYPGNTIAGVVVRNNTLQNGLGDGILASDGSLSGSSFLQNVIANNCGRAMFIAENCTNNLVADNKVFNNGDEIKNDGSNNLLDDNTEFNNNLSCDFPDGFSARQQPEVGLRYKK